MILERREFKPLSFTLSKQLFYQMYLLYFGGILDVIIGNEICHVHRASIGGKKIFEVNVLVDHMGIVSN